MHLEERLDSGAWAELTLHWKNHNSGLKYANGNITESVKGTKGLKGNCKVVTVAAMCWFTMLIRIKCEFAAAGLQLCAMFGF